MRERTRVDLIRVGLFVTVATGVLVGALLWIAGSRFFRPVATYIVRFDQSVSGLNAGANVEYQGVVVGRVRNVELTADLPPQVAVVVDLAPGTPVRTDTEAALLGSLVTGIKFIQLQGGTANAEPLAPGAVIRGEAPSLEAFRDRLSEIADRVTAVLRTLQQDVFTDANSQKLNGFLSDLGAVASTLNRTMETFRAQETGESFAHLVRSLAETADKANTVLTDFYARRNTIYGQLDSSLTNIDASARALRTLVDTAGSKVTSTGRSVDTLVDQLTVATTRLQETLEVIQGDPSLLLWGQRVPERELAR
jgi:phospholipid/cholesterol/gamma-HCH transport system substrate-binding protein